VRLLPLQRLRPHYFAAVEDDLRLFFWQEVFAPLLAVVKDVSPGAAAAFANTAEPAPQALLRALGRGAVQYRDGVFAGEFSAEVMRQLRALGAEHDRAAGVWRLPEWTAPGAVKAAAQLANRKADQVGERLLKLLGQMRERLDEGALVPRLDAAGPLAAIEDGFASAAKALGIEKEIGEAQRRAIEKAYQDNVRPYVVEATAKFIDDVHAEVTENAAQGFRYERLVSAIEKGVGVSERKARFLARQETGLFMANYRRTRFEAAGVTRYMWSTSHDARVRPAKGADPRQGDHRALDKQVFYYATKAPAAFMSSKKPCNPGEDFNCRCNDRALVE
jgi:SPP1 gp7 family putative phage head morphogenesis protein